MMKRLSSRYKVRQACALLPNTAWGRSAESVIQEKSASSAVQFPVVRWYNWGDKAFGEMVAACRSSGAQVMILVANEVEAALIVREMAALPLGDRVPIVSHWGVTGGNFEKLAPEAANIDFHVVQTFSFHKPQTDKAKAFLEEVLASTGKTKISEIDSPAGIVHAYDLTWLVAKALASTGRVDRGLLRDAMERLGSHDGVVRRYERPFTPDRHDALSAQDVFFARYHAQSGLTPEE
jgi:branched-chain amino acid transport system substrate-binding protein